MGNPYEKKTTKTHITSLNSNKKKLLNPTIFATDPLSIFFNDIESKINFDVFNVSIDEAWISVFSDEDIITNEFEYKRYKLVEKFLDYLLEIKNISENIDHDNKNLLKISLHDLKTFGKIFNFIVIKGIYPSLHFFNIGIDISKRLLNQSIKYKSDNFSIANYEYCEKLLSLIFVKLHKIFSDESDVKSLLIKGTGLLDFVTVSVALITIPQFKTVDRSYIQEQLEHLLYTFDTFQLFEIYTLYMQTQSPSYFKSFIINKLQCLHCDKKRKNGLAVLIDFLLNLRETHEFEITRFEHFFKVISIVPSGMKSEEYFLLIFDQIYLILGSNYIKIIKTCICFSLNNFWIQNKSIITSFFLKKIWKIFIYNDLSSYNKILVSDKELEHLIQVLISICENGVKADLLQMTFKPIILFLWEYYVFLQSKSIKKNELNDLLVCYFKILKQSNSKEITELDTITKNLFSDGNDMWEFELLYNGKIQIKARVKITSKISRHKLNDFLSFVNHNCNLFINFLKLLDFETIENLFISVLTRWINIDSSKKICIKNDYPFIFVDFKLLESICENFKDKFGENFFSILEITNIILQSEVKKINNDVNQSFSNIVLDEQDSDDEIDEFDCKNQILPVILDLVTTILIQNVFEKNTNVVNHLNLIKESLNFLIKDQKNISSSIIESCRQLRDKISISLNNESFFLSDSESDRKVFDSAISSLNSAIIPIKTQGLNMIRNLIKKKSKIISLDYVINLHFQHLNHNDPFVYLNVISGFESLLSLNQCDVSTQLIQYYLNKDNDLDNRLKIGEVLLRYIQRTNEALTGQLIKLIVNTLLSIIRRNEDESLNYEDKIRVSSLSLLSICFKTNSIEMFFELDNILDCIFGILQLETQKNKANVRQSAVLLTYDIIDSFSKTENCIIPIKDKKKIYNILSYLKETDNDFFVREQCDETFKLIKEISTPWL